MEQKVITHSLPDLGIFATQHEISFLHLVLPFPVPLKDCISVLNYNKNFMLTFNETLIRLCFGAIIQIMCFELLSFEYICIKEELNLIWFFEVYPLSGSFRKTKGNSVSSLQVSKKKRNTFAKI